MKDLYGNEQQTDTPTTLILEHRLTTKAESDGHFKLGTRVYPSLKRQAVADLLRKVAEVVEGTNAEAFHVEFTIEGKREV